MTIDATAGTVLTSFHGDYELLEYLKYDITNIVHYIRHHSKILIIGTGGGRDILSALLFQQKSIVGIEINKEIINAVNRSFANFTGCLDTMANVTFVHDEARSYIARSKEKFDIIQASLTDTWAATAVGAFCLTENSLYTVEGWKIFLDHLSPNGILTFSRWYFKDRPDEMHRLTSLAGEALRQYGFENPRNHIMIARRMIKGKKGIEPEGVGTMLVSKSPFSRMEIETIGNITDSLKFEVVLSPYYSIDYIFSKLTAKTSDPIFLEQYPLNISPPTDENPFFFHMFKLKTLTLNNPIDQGSMSFNLKAIFILIVFLVIVILLLSLCIILPLKLTIDKSTINGSSPFSFYFLTIGIGFMLIEISQMQRLNIFLGHPTYGLSVVLFSLLVSSSIGSLTTQKLKIEGMSTEMRLLVLCITLIVFGFLTPTILLMFEASLTPIRIIVAVLLLFPIGLFMGMAFPIGLKFATIKNYKIIPWLWGINGAASVFSSVLAVVLSISWSISITYWIGCICYIAALLIFLSIRKFLSLPLSL
jgi:hypothetical protein